MDKQEILDQLRSFPYDRNGYWVIAGSAMVLWGIKKQTADIDLGCSSKLADRLSADGYPFRYTESGNRHFKLGDSIEIFENWLQDKVETIEGYQVVSLQGLIGMKQKLGREKDLKDIEMIRAYLKQKQGE